jgi:hypothetical protein
MFNAYKKFWPIRDRVSAQYSYKHDVAYQKTIVYGAYTLATLPRIVTPYRDSVDETRALVTYQKLVTR